MLSASRSLFALLVVGAWASLPSTPARAQSADTDKVLWTSTSANAADFAGELSDLYVTLYNAGRLSLNPSVIARSDSIEAVLRENGNLVGPRFPPALESLACDLNANRCQRERSPSSDPKIAQSKSLTGFAPSATRWQLRPGDALVLPAVRLTVIPKWVQVSIERRDGRVCVGYEKSCIMRSGYYLSADTLGFLVTNLLGGCVAYDRTCQQEILKYNRKLDEAALQDGLSDYLGVLSLPVIAARATVDISSAIESPRQTSQKEERPDQPLELTPAADGSFKVKNFGVKTEVPAGFDSSKSQVLKDLQLNSVGSAITGKRFATPAPVTLFAADFNREQSDLSALIKFPYKNLTDYPLPLKGGATVGLFDSWIDASHCAFSSERFKVNNITNSPPGASRGNCDEKADSGDFDHGTHIAGLIAGKSPNGNNFGLNPYATVLAYEVDFSKLTGNPNELVALSDKFDTMPSANAEVVNLSFGYMFDPRFGSQDPLLRSIANLVDRTLVVVAAGNYGADVSYICDVRPTCFDLPNVMVVAALDRGNNPPDLLGASTGRLLTNYGSRVHIGAIGENVFSTVAFGRYGIASGTSFAAPQVAAVASLVMRKYRRMSPQEVKNRLIYCSDHVSVLARISHTAVA